MRGAVSVVWLGREGPCWLHALLTQPLGKTVAAQI